MMSRRHRPRDEVFAVLRADVPCADPEVDVYVKEIVRTREIADREVARLNKLNAEKKWKYWVQPTRLFPKDQSEGA
jgi:hypothetical protein